MKRNGRRLFEVPDQIRERHLYLIGKTRMGKSSLIKNLLTQDMHRGAGVGFLDPHGDDSYSLLGNVPEARIPEVIYFDPSSPTAPAFNPFRLPYPPAKLTTDLVSVFKLLFGDSWGYRMEHILRFSFLTLITQREPRSLADLHSLLVDKDFRADVVRTTEHERLRLFWQKEFPTIEKSAVNPIINKLSEFLLPTSPLERTFSEKENDLDFSHILDTGKIFIMNSAKGAIGDEPSRLLGGFITAGIQQAALAREAIPVEKRRPFYFFIDECQNYAIKSVKDILSENSKYGLFLTLANQTLEQISDLQAAIFGNVGTIVSFRVSADNATKLQKEMRGKRLKYRLKGTGSYLPISHFIETQGQFLRDSITQAQGRIAEASSPSPWDEQSVNIAEYELRQLANFNGNVAMLKERYGEGYEFREIPFPDADDLTDLPRFSAFARIGRATNVFRFKTLPSPPPNEQHRQRILSLMQERYEARRKADSTRQPARDLSRPEPKRQPPPDDEKDDFSY